MGQKTEMTKLALHAVSDFAATHDHLDTSANLDVRPSILPLIFKAVQHATKGYVECPADRTLAIKCQVGR